MEVRGSPPGPAPGSEVDAEAAVRGARQDERARA
jgi:hypothetical protein